MSNWPLEADFLLECTRPSVSGTAVASIRERVDRGVNWVEVLRLSIAHGLLPALTTGLERDARELVPSTTLAQLMLYRRRAAVRSENQAQVLVSVLAELKRGSIRALPFKGPVLAMQAFGDSGRRESHDLDLWVGAERRRAAELLRSRGYRRVEHARGEVVHAIGEGTEDNEFLDPTGQVLIELHGGLQAREYSFAPDFDEVWERRGAVLLVGVEVPAFAVADLLPLLAVHGSKHMWRRANWVLDVAALLAACSEQEIEVAWERARSWRCERRLLVAITLATLLYGANEREGDHPQLSLFYGTHSKMKTALLRRAVRNDAGRLRRRLFDEREERTIGSFAGEVVHHYRSFDDAAGRLRIVGHSLSRIARAEEGAVVSSMSGGLRIAQGAVSRARRLVRTGTSGGG